MTDEIVGAVRSITIVRVAGELADGPTCVPVTELAKSWGINVPSPQPDAVMVKLVPVEVSGVKVHPVAVPALEKSEDATPVTDWDKANE